MSSVGESSTWIKSVNVNGFSSKFVEQICKLQKGKLNVCRTEKALLQSINEVIIKCDPDVLLGHDFAGFTLPVLAQRMKSQRIEGVQLGRLAFKQWPKGTGTGPNSSAGMYADRQLVSGRLLLDTYLSAKEFVKAKNYSLAQLTETVLNARGNHWTWTPSPTTSPIPPPSPGSSRIVRGMPSCALSCHASSKSSLDTPIDLPGGQLVGQDLDRRAC